VSRSILTRALFCITLLGAAAVAPAAASAADSCRASAARETAPGEATSEPVVANPPGSPCRTDSREAGAAEPVGSATVAFPRADTERDEGIIAASSSVEGAQAPMGGVPVSVGAVEATQVARCVDGVTVTEGSSSVDALEIAGTPVTIAEDEPMDFAAGPVRVRANQVVDGTRRALVLDDGTGRELVLGEASATGDACAAPADDGGGLGQICPAGADYDVDSNLCVIHEGEAGGADGTQETIVIGHPFEGPRGGTLISLDEARQRVANGTLTDSPCLRGGGPEYVVLGTHGTDRITGGNGRDRILGRRGGDRISGGLGADCIDGGSGGDRLTGDNGGDRLHGGVGRDAVNGGSGTDRLQAGAGNDSINTGFGRDFVSSGPGRDAINAATAGSASKRILCGRGSDTLRINRNERRRHAGCETVYTIR
jgi:hypothetical protein